MFFSEIVHFNKRKWNVHLHWSDADMTVTANINWASKQKGEKISSDRFTLKYRLEYLPLNLGFEGIVANTLGAKKEIVLRTL